MQHCAELNRITQFRIVDALTTTKKIRNSTVRTRPMQTQAAKRKKEKEKNSIELEKWTGGLNLSQATKGS